MLFKVASSEEVQRGDLHAGMDHQIHCPDQLGLADCYYDSLVITSLLAIAKSNVVTGYICSLLKPAQVVLTVKER
jgi:hypothetical protein